MKTFFQTKGPTYNMGDDFTVGVRKDCVEFYLKLKKGHAVVNVEIFRDGVRVSVVCGEFANQLFDKVLQEGLNIDSNPKLMELLEAEDKYKIITYCIDGEDETRIFMDIEKSFPNWLSALGNPEVDAAIRGMIDFFLDLYNELIKSPSPSVRALARNFYG